MLDFTGQLEHYNMYEALLIQDVSGRVGQREINWSTQLTPPLSQPGVASYWKRIKLPQQTSQLPRAESILRSGASGYLKSRDQKV